jgi:hypothetical protein
MYRVEISIAYIHTYGLGTSQVPTYIGPQYKKKTMYVEISIYMGTTVGLHNIQDLSRIPQKYHKKYRLSQTIYTPYAYL